MPSLFGSNKSEIDAKLSSVILIITVISPILAIGIAWGALNNKVEMALADIKEVKEIVLKYVVKDQVAIDNSKDNSN